MLTIALERVVKRTILFASAAWNLHLTEVVQYLPRRRRRERKDDVRPPTGFIAL